MVLNVVVVTRKEMGIRVLLTFQNETNGLPLNSSFSELSLIISVNNIVPLTFIKSANKPNNIECY